VNTLPLLHAATRLEWIPGLFRAEPRRQGTMSLSRTAFDSQTHERARFYELERIGRRPTRSKAAGPIRHTHEPNPVLTLFAIDLPLVLRQASKYRDPRIVLLNRSEFASG